MLWIRFVGSQSPCVRLLIQTNHYSLCCRWTQVSAYFQEIPPLHRIGITNFIIIIIIIIRRIDDIMCTPHMPCVQVGCVFLMIFVSLPSNKVSYTHTCMNIILEIEINLRIRNFLAFRGNRRAISSWAASVDMRRMDSFPEQTLVQLPKWSNHWGESRLYGPVCSRIHDNWKLLWDQCHE